MPQSHDNDNAGDMADLSVLNPHPTFLPGPQLLHELIPSVPNDPAIAIEYLARDGTLQSFTYAQLHGAANALAERLRLLSGTTSRFIVPLFLPQTPALYIAQLAILKSGGAFCPLPLDAPEDRLRFILEDVDAVCLLTNDSSKSNLSSLAGNNVEIICVDEFLSQSASADASISIDPSQPAYEMYTSGSTGTPKGVLISHTAATQALLAHDRHIPAFSRFLQFASPTFDVSVFEIFFPLLRHATLIACDRRDLLNDLPGVINRLRVDAAELTPSVASSLLQDRTTTPSLKLLLTIGEMLKRSVVEEFGGDANQPAILYGMYGPTEATIHCTLQPAFQKDMSVGNIGIPLDTVSAFIIKPLSDSSAAESVAILPKGEEGELAVGGFQLADGYINRDEQTAAAFVRHPTHGRLYRTGDRAVITAEGRLECLGRISAGQVKLRGQRIELGEVEYAAIQASCCQTATAEVIHGLLILFCVSSDSSSSIDAIRESCRRWLPAFMVPNDIILLDTLPYLASGKIDRKALITVFDSQESTSTPSVNEMTGDILNIAQAISTLLNIHVDASTKLRNAGLDSLNAIRLAAVLSKQGYPRVDANRLLAVNSIDEVNMLFHETREQADDHSVQATTQPIDQNWLRTKLQDIIANSFHDLDESSLTVYPCTPTQCAMLAETARDYRAYCNRITLEVDSAYSEERVEHSIRTLISTTDLFRTGFVEASGSASAYIAVLLPVSTLIYPEVVKDFQLDFHVATPAELLRPSRVQLRERNGTTQILFQLHHALYDQWTIDLLKVRLAALLTNSAAITSPSFHDVALYHQHHAVRTTSDDEIEFWQDRLREFSPTPLPRLRGRLIAPRTSRTAWHLLDLNMQDMRSVCHDLECSLPSVFQAAFAYMLSVWSGTPSVTFGIVTAGRNIALPGIDQILGPCLSTLPCLVDLGTVSRVLDLLQTIHYGNRVLQQHSLTPLSIIKRAAQCSPQTALFDSLFIWQETSLDMTSTDGIIAEAESADYTEFNLVFEVEPRLSGVAMRATYQKALLDDDQLSLLYEQIQSLVTWMLGNPQAPILDMATAFSTHLLSVANPHPVNVSSIGIVAEVENRAKTQPQAEAIMFMECLFPDVETITWNFTQLNETANRVAHALLVDSRATASASVYIWMEKSPFMYAAILGTWKAGLGYIPLAHDTPISRARSIVTQTAVGFSLCDEGTVHLAQSVIGDGAVEVQSFIAGHSSKTNPNVPFIASNVAYTIFTSGSTGEPKGVPITFGNISGNVAALTRLYSTVHGDRLLQACSPAFDVSVFEIFFAMSTGICLCAARKEVLLEDLERSVRRLGITHLSLTPTVAALINPDKVPSVKFLVTAGEGVTDAVHNAWAGRGLHQGYGPSETTNICTINMNVESDDILGNIGTVLENTSGFVIDAGSDFTVLPLGAAGEFAFGGEQVFDGYLNRPDLNSQALIQHPEYGRLYRSGDMGRMLADGTFISSGRRDDQIKLRGNRIEIGEISAAIMRSPVVADAATILLHDESSDPYLVTVWTSADKQDACYEVQVRQGSSNVTQDLFAVLEDTLPAYMIPSLVVPISRMPHTTQGKLDKRLLKDIVDKIDIATRNSFSRTFEETCEEDTGFSSDEREIAASLAKVLGIPDASISRHTSFFALGLNSLSAIAFSNEIRNRLGKRVKVEQILRNPTVARLGRKLSEGAETSSDHRIVGLASNLDNHVQEAVLSNGLDIEAVLPCTPLQEAMLLTGNSNTTTYCNSTHFIIHGDLDRLRWCWEQMAKRHAILRTIFVETNSPEFPVVQLVLRHKSPSWNDGGPYLNGHTTSGEGSIVTMIKPYRLLLRYMRGSTHLILQMHHAIYDGVSLSILLQEIEQCYGEKSLPPSIDMSPFLAEVQAHKGDRALTYWRSVVQTLRPRLFPRQATDGSQETLRLTLDMHPQLLQRFCTQHSTTLLSILHAAWVKVLRVIQGTDDVCFGNVVSGRSVDVPSIERLVAPCFNTIPMRAQTATVRSNLDLIKVLQKQSISSLEYQLTPLRRIQALSQIPDRHLFDSLIILQPEFHKPEKAIWAITGEDGVMDLPLVVEFSVGAQEIQLDLYYESPLIPDSLAEQIASATEASIASCLSFPANTIDHFSHFDPMDMAGCLEEDDHDKHYTGRDSPAIGNDEPWTESESMVRAAFSELSGVDVSKISKHTSLYSLGLDSLNAVQVAAKLRNQDLYIDAADVAKYLTPFEISQQAHRTAPCDSITRKTHGGFSEYDAQIRPVVIRALGLNIDNIEAVRPCTPMQQGLLAQSVHSGGSLYINHISYLVPAEVTMSLIVNAWRTVQSKHQILRMGFYNTEDDGAFAMIIYNHEYSSSLPLHPAGSLGKPQDELATQAEIIKELHKPTWRLTLSTQDGHNVMTFSIHHALFDADSLQTLFKDFSVSLSSRAIGPPGQLDAMITAQLVESVQETEKAQSYWHELLRTAVLNKFPNLCPGVVRTGITQSVSLTSRHSKETVEGWCKSMGVTIQALGQGTWARLLASYIGDDQVTFGTVFSTRPGDAPADSAFPCIATVPVSCDVKQAGTDIVKEMLAQNIASQEHRRLPLTEIQRAAGRPAQNLFDTVFVYQKGSDPRLSWTLHKESVSVDYALSLELEISQGGEIHLRVTFNDDIIPTEQANLLLRQFDYLFAELANPRNERVSDNSDVHAITPAITPILPAPVAHLHEFVSMTAKQTPERVALEFIDNIEHLSPKIRQWTYSQLDARGNQVAQLIRSNGIESGNIIAVCMDRSPEASFVFLGILKAGCSFLAMDPDLPHTRRKFILEDSGASILFVSPGKQIGYEGTEALIVEATESTLVQLSSSEVDNERLSPEQTCYILYTSGTTGNPKGCEITHTNAVQAMMAFQKLFTGRWDQDSRWLQFASYWFDVSILEQFWSWGVGITVVGASRDLILEDIPAFIRVAKITHIDLTPSLAVLVHPDDVPTLHDHVFITGGEAIKQDIIDAWGPKHTVCNGYGPTEATIGVTMLRFLGPDTRPSNIGTQFDNVGTLVLDPHSDSPVLRGGIGELCITGQLVGKGYLNRPELTAKAFPFLERFGERAYRTGDLVRILHDGSFSFVGRKDTQAKLRGQRLEIGEIERAIQDSSEKILGVVCTVMKHANNNRELLIGFISTNQRQQAKVQLDTSSTAAQLAQNAVTCCQTRLPPYMVPTHVIPITFIPLTPNNKTDNKRLNALYEALSIQDLQILKQTDVEDRVCTPEETKVAKILGTLLKIDFKQITPSSNIFNLGLSSISAIQLNNALRRDGYTRSSTSTIMRKSTVRQLVQALTDSQNEDNTNSRSATKQAQLRMAAFSKRWRADAADKLAVSPEKIEIIVPCTPLQEGMLLDSIHNSQRPYFNQFRYDTPKIDLERLQTAIDETTTGIQVHRAKFVQCDEGFAQVIMKTNKISFQVFEDGPDSERYLNRHRVKWLQENAHQICRPLEIILIRGHPRDTIVFNVHHAIYDGISWELFIDRIGRSYMGDQCQDDLHIPNFCESLPYGPLQSMNHAQSYWKNKLSGTCSGALRKTLSIDGAASVSNSFEITSLRDFHETRRVLGVSHQALIQICFETALLQAFPETNMYGQVVSGRSLELENADKIIGPLFNTVPAVIKIGSKQTWEDCIHELHKSNVEMLPYQHTPLRSIRKWIGQDAAASIFAAIFVFQSENDSQSSGKREAWCLQPHEPIASFPLAFEATLTSNDTLQIEVVGQQQYLDTAILNDFVSNFKKAFEITILHHSKPIAEHFRIPDCARNVEARRDPVSPTRTAESSKFEWNKNASRVRQILAQSAEVDETLIDEKTTFFGLGLDSIDAVKFSSRLKKDGMNITMSQVIQAQTVSRILEIIDQNTSQTSGNGQTNLLQELESRLRASLSIPDAEMDTLERVLPATPNQEAMIADMLRSDFTEYYNHDILRISPDLQLQDLVKAWQKVADNHAILRTGFVEASDPELDCVFAQLVHRPGTLNVSRLSLVDQPDFGIIEEDIRRSAMQDSTYGRSPFRLTVVEAQTERYLILSLAHAQYDGHSLALIHADVQKAINGSNIDRPSYDSAIELILQASTEDAKRFWADTLLGSKPVPFPLKYSVDTTEEFHRKELIARISSDKARSFCRKHGCSMQTLAQTSWALVLAHYTQSCEVRFGAVLACRDSEMLEEMVYPVMNTIVMTAILHGSLKEMVMYMQSMYNSILPFRRLPLREIQSAARDQGGIKGASIFDTLFIYQQRPEDAKDARNPLYESVRASSRVDYPVAAELEAEGDQIVFRAACKSTALGSDEVLELLHCLDTVLGHIVDSPEEPTLEISGKLVSICKMPSFQPQNHVLSTGTHTPEDQEDGSETPNELLPMVNHIRHVLSQVSKVPESSIDIATSIETIGIDSISAIKVVSLLRQRKLNISVSKLIRANTVGKIAAAIHEEKATIEEAQPAAATAVLADILSTPAIRDAPSTKGVAADNIEAILPASAGQVYMINSWIASQGRLFYSTFAHKVTGSISRVKIESAWQNLVARHQALRTVLCSTSDNAIPLVQVILKTVSTSQGSKAVQRPDCPMASLEICPDADGWLVKVSLHHALYDAISLNVMMEDFQKILEGKVLSTCDHSSFADFLTLSLTPQARKDQYQFWREYFATADPMSMATSREPKVSARVEVWQPELWLGMSQVEQLARWSGISTHSLLFAIYAKLYAQMVSKSGGHKGHDVVLGVYLSNRAHLPDLSELASPTLNLVPLLVRAVHTTSTIDLARQVQRDLQEIGTPARSAVGLWKIAEWTGICVDTFVNLVKLPDTESGSVSQFSDVQLVEYDESKQKPYIKLVGGDETAAFEMPAELIGIRGADAYLPSLDFEASITQGALNVGLFCPEAVLGVGDVDGLLNELKRLLDECVM